MKRSPSFLLLAAAVALTPGKTARAGCMDQEQSSTSTHEDFWADRSLAQTFTPSITGVLDHVRIPITALYEGDAYSIVVSVIETIGGTPNGNVLGQVEFSGYDDYILAWRSADFLSQNIVLTAGTQYAFVLTCDASYISCRETAISKSRDYLGGQAWSRDAGSQWEPITNDRYDLAFRTYMVVAAGDTLHVPSEYPTIQAAMDAAVCGDTVLLADGVYTGPDNTNLDFDGKAVTVRSENGAANCIIDCENEWKAFNIQDGEDHSSVVEGITIRRSKSSAIFCGSQSSFTLRNCRLTDNHSSVYGGAIFLGTGTRTVITGCTIESNSAEFGGGIWCQQTELSIDNCVFRDNQASTDGGGIRCLYADRMAISDCILSGNTAERWGGGAYLRGDDTIVRNSVFDQNSANSGGGVSLADQTTLVNCFFLDNSADTAGGGVCEDATSWATLVNCTFRGNTAVEGGSELAWRGGGGRTMTNCIVWGSSPNAFDLDVGILTITHCDIQGGQAAIELGERAILNWGSGNIDADPLFARASDVHLTCGSPCIGAGDPAGVYDGQTDLDGQPREIYAAVDIGADEFAWTADFDLDADVDLADFAQLQSCFNGPNRPPASAGCDAVDFDADSDVDIADFGVFGGCFNGPNRQPRCL